VQDLFTDLAERYNHRARSCARWSATSSLTVGSPSIFPARVADVGGGAGQQAIPLSRRGYEVTIIDPSPKMLAEARQRLVREEAGVRLVGDTGGRAHETLGGEMSKN